MTRPIWKMMEVDEMEDYSSLWKMKYSAPPTFISFACRKATGALYNSWRKDNVDCTAQTLGHCFLLGYLCNFVFCQKSWEGNLHELDVTFSFRSLATENGTKKSWENKPLSKDLILNGWNWEILKDSIQTPNKKLVALERKFGKIRKLYKPLQHAKPARRSRAEKLFKHL